jgi:hypothetical protein
MGKIRNVTGYYRLFTLLNNVSEKKKITTFPKNIYGLTKQIWTTQVFYYDGKKIKIETPEPGKK